MPGVWARKCLAIKPFDHLSLGRRQLAPRSSGHLAWCRLSIGELMLSREENDLITKVGPGTPMGELMRQYWIPALLAEEIREPDCAPVRLRLLGEDLVAFRDSMGRVGLLAEHCSHRGTSLFYGRNEECGLRCIYHGWKYDIDGRVLETPAEP